MSLYCLFIGRHVPHPTGHWVDDGTNLTFDSTDTPTGAPSLSPVVIFENGTQTKPIIDEIVEYVEDELAKEKPTVVFSIVLLILLLVFILGFMVSR